MQLSTYTQRHVSIEGLGISRNTMSKGEDVTDMRESAKMTNAVQR